MKFIPLAFLLMASSVSALTIELDYTYDTQDFGTGTAGFFANNAQAKSALEAAAFDLGNAISSNFAAINVAAGTSISGASGGTTIDINPNWSFTNPTTGSTVNLDGLNLSANTFRVYVGSRNLSGNTLGQGGHGGFGYGANGSFSGNTSTYVPAMNAAINNTVAVTGRGMPVTIGNLGTTTFNIGGTDYTSTAQLTYGPTLGNLWFDADTNNNGATDNLAELGASWNFNHNTTSFGGKNDFYSVALHEIMHSMGVGSSSSWNANVTEGAPGGNKDWTGSQVIALKGSGTDTVDSGGAHIASGVTGAIIDGQSATSTSSGTQDSVMAPSITTGTRKTLTEVDLAFMKDMGYTVAAVPEPSTYAVMTGFACLAGVALRRRRRIR
jgi:hypothetical protein